MMTDDEFRNAAAARLDRVKCPTCDGTGTTRTELVAGARPIAAVCSTCDGSKILFRPKRGTASPDAPCAHQRRMKHPSVPHLWMCPDCEWTSHDLRL